MVMLKTPEHSLPVLAFAAVFLLSASVVSIAATVSSDDNAVATQSGPTTMGDRNAPRKPPTHSIGTVIDESPAAESGVKRFVKPVHQTFQGAWFYDYGSVRAGENAIKTDLRNTKCQGHRLTDMHFDRFHYTVVNYVVFKEYSATNINGSLTCEM
jgi:hypothetical protein